MKTIFISYCHKDAEYKDKLVEQLKVLQLEEYCTFWVDDQIKIGTDWFDEIQAAINKAHIAILMVSAGFLTSQFILGKELPPILRRRKTKGLKVLPLFMKPCTWKKVPWLKEIQGFPSGDKTIMEMDEAEQLRQLAQFAESIYELLFPESKEKNTTHSSRPVFASPQTQLFTPLPARRIQLIGRENELTQLDHMLTHSPRVVLVNGMGGIGKTEVCKTYFLDHYPRYVSAAWVEGLGTLRDSLVNALGGDHSTFIQVGERDTQAERYEKIVGRLREVREPFLLVLDNMDNPDDPDLLTLTTLPAVIKIVASSRAVIHDYQLMCLDYLSPTECQELFCRFYKGPAAENVVAQVVECCGYHTLTVELLARTIHFEGKSVEWLLETFLREGFRLPTLTGGDIPCLKDKETEKKNVAQHLEKVFDIAVVPTVELGVLVNMSVLPPLYIPMEWVREWLELDGMVELNGLVERGWLKRDNEARVYMHPVIQEVVRYCTQPNGEKCRVLIRSLANKFEIEPTDNPMEKKMFLPYGEAVLRELATEEKEEKLARLASNVSECNWHMGQLELALEFQLKAFKIREKVLAPNHPDLAESYNNVSSIYWSTGQLELALEFQLKALKIRKEVLDPNHPDLAQSYSNFSTIYWDMGQLELALEFQLKALKIREEVLDPNHPDLAQSYNNLSTFYRAMAQLERALEFQLKALKIKEEVLDPNHRILATSYYNLSFIYRDMNNYPSAQQFAQQAVVIWEKNFPEGHSDLEKAKRNLEAIKKKVSRRYKKSKKEAGRKKRKKILNNETHETKG